ncbi:CpCCp3, multidomain extracellular protein with a signal peptide and the following architecture: LH2+LCCL+2xSR+LCCL+pentraxin+2xLCCL, related [Eimeria acervulina]|uniref:CpCCp3, multidomain extracellular protein with a signal peptide and the following architecture: LH2+LCCL+2xSR+LCCL+pentraxin+2xLCCL, related n=1 Tax=Eimeria acervulina TaxID=5801 RepID=U6GDM1_EIMAC|nr:CpCCp3, multidomain extracellular protein with a signal peptide and the following architecture: LH2+LCCL+2xSR+LCCL+pentraxin+2xLCCL, related [Eimeria acervulina]CDI78250.1 CpCCp3, multidomain extracellular protein with a signal peptide and the following architecture: LH2+LCCL+2xSR+LCCL+pentraxin+2xLCCL, related [Eimeria acervulina]
MTIGRASAAEADYFEGDILGVKLFSQEVPATTIQNAFSAETLAAHIPQAPSESRRTEDGRLCLSPCSLQGPRWAAAAAAAAAARVTKPAVLLSCTDSLRRVEFNGRIGQTFLAVCPPDCLHAKALLEGCKFFTARSSICKASLHTGAMPKEGGEVLLTVAEGRTFYDASQGHFGFYSLLSSVCRAAIHAGALKDVGGEVEIIASRGRQRFSGSAVNGIASETSGEYIRSFVFVTPSSASSSAEGVEAISRSTAGSQRQLS